MLVLFLKWLAADGIPTNLAQFGNLPKGLTLTRSVLLSCSQVLRLYRIICTKEEPGNMGRKMCTLLQCINKQLEFMAGNSKQWGYMQTCHSKPSCMSSLFIDVFLLNAINGL